MFSAAVSTIALALAIGPQLQLSLQAVMDEAQPAIAVPVADNAGTPTAEIIAEPDPSAVIVAEAQQTDSAIEPAQDPIEVDQEVSSTDTDASDPQPAATETEPETQVQSGQVDQAEWPVILSQMSAALSSATTAKGNFIQTNADGSVSTGTFALNRPGRMRFDYDDPTPILIVSNGTTVAMEDSELETVDRVPIGSTPLGLILSTDLGFDRDVDVLSVMRNEDRVGVRVSDSSGELEGTLTMVFDAQNFDLLGWLAIDGNLQTTVVDLVDVETNVRIDPRLFRLDEEDDEEDER
ncbi:MAG: outer-membrane lipoprotein carrier protein LolA [Hyphomonas sp.]|nr:outer-membrane lipoprotein carrier protein LolA [Hyphomonas sp.]